MARPKLAENKKRKALSVSLSPEIRRFVDGFHNKSMLVEKAIRCAIGVSETLKTAGPRLSRAEAAALIDDIGDIMAGWDTFEEERVPLEAMMAELERKDRRRRKTSQQRSGSRRIG